MIREDEKNGVLFFDYNMARGEFEKKLYNMFVKEDYSLDTIISWAISYGELHNRWISVKEELPPTSDKDDESVDYLIVDEDGEMNVGYYNKMDKLWFSCDGYILGVTHWMPLPQPPLVTDLNKKDLPPVSWQEGNILVEEEGGEKMDFFTWKERHEYYRTKGYEQGYEDAINKACEWIHSALYLDHERSIEHRYATLEELLNDFRKAMKGGEE